MTKLVITNGDSAAALLKAAGVAGDELLPWRDILHEGPVIDDGDLRVLSARRAAYLSESHVAATEAEATAAAFADRDALFCRHRSFESVELWFEHDLYDQLQLVQILTLLHRDGRYHGVVLIQAPGHLGKETPETIGRFEDLARPVPPEAFRFADQVWTAFAAGTPDDLLSAVSEENVVDGEAALRFVRPSMLRLLAELPDAVFGLSQTEWLILEQLRRHGPLRAGPLFNAYSDAESAAFHGDLSFFDRLDRLKARTPPLVIGPEGCYRSVERDADGRPVGPYLHTPFALTEAGEAVMSGHMSSHPGPVEPYWIGATEITKASPWRWDRAKRTLVHFQGQDPLI